MDEEQENGIFFGGCSWACLYYGQMIDKCRQTWQHQSYIPVGGSSSGALTALAFALGKSSSSCIDMYNELASQVIISGAVGNMSKYQSKILDDWLPDHGDEFQSLNGRLFIGITKFPFTSCLVSQWCSNVHLKETLHQSVHIPLYCERYMPHWCIDGALLKSFWAIPTARYTWSVSALQPSADIFPASDSSYPRGLPLSMTIWPVPADKALEIISMGAKDFDRCVALKQKPKQRTTTQITTKRTWIYVVRRVLSLIIWFVFFLVRNKSKVYMLTLLASVLLIEGDARLSLGDG